MVMPSRKASPLVVIQPELPFEVLIDALCSPALFE